MAKREDIDEFIQKYACRQHRPDMCWSAAIKTVLDELADRHKNTKLKIPLNKINKICNYKEGFGIQPEIPVPAFNHYFEKHKINYQAMEREGQNNWKLLNNVLIEKESSYPMINVPISYINEFKECGYSVPGAPDWLHVIIVLNINNDDVKIYDPYEAYILHSSNVKNPPKALKAPIFMKYWREAKIPYWIMWFREIKKNKKSKKGESLKNVPPIEDWENGR